MADRWDSPVAPAPAPPARGQLTPAEKVMLALMVAMVAMIGGVFVSVLSLQRQVGDLRVEIHQEFGDLRTDLGRQINDLRTDVERQINDLRTDLGQRMARLEAIMVAHLGTPPLPADGAGDNAPAQ